MNYIWRKAIHPLLYMAMVADRRLNKKLRIHILNKRWIGDDPVIFAVTHVGKDDYQIVSEAIGIHQIPFSGDPEIMRGTFDGFILWLNGVVYCDTDDKLDRKAAFKESIRILNSGYSLLIYPEGVWNLSANLPVLPLFPGVIRMAQETGLTIIPVAIEQYGRAFYINFGRPYTVSKTISSQDDNKYELDRKKQELRDILATLKWEIYEYQSVKHRDNMSSFEVEYRRFRDERLYEWHDKNGNPYYNDELVKQRTFREY